jgi:predicted alpha/beta hydrolase
MKLLALSTIMSAEHIENGFECPPFRVPLNRYRRPGAVAAFVVLPAMGMQADFYRPFAELSQARGYNVVVPELPGTGASKPRPSRRVDYGYRDLVETYLPRLLELARSEAEGKPLVLLGHSLGAHAGMLGLATGKVSVDALVTIAGGNIHYRNWAGPAALKVLVAALAFPAISAVAGHLPGQHLGFGGPQARTLIREWSQVIRTGRYAHVYPDLSPAAGTPTLCIGIDGDRLAPERSVRGLADMVGGDVLLLAAAPRGHPHSSWARQPGATLAATERWLAERGVIPSPGVPIG